MVCPREKTDRDDGGREDEIKIFVGDKCPVGKTFEKWLEQFLHVYFGDIHIIQQLV
jgi:hypothetical protein